MKLRIINVHTKINVLFEFGSLVLVYVEMMSKELLKLSLNRSIAHAYIHIYDVIIYILILTNTEDTGLNQVASQQNSGL